MIDKEPTLILNQSEYTVTHGDKIIEKGITLGEVKIWMVGQIKPKEEPKDPTRTIRVSLPSIPHSLP